MELKDMHISKSIVIERSPEDLYDMVADVTRMGDWSEACTGATWDDGASLAVGSWFTGHNKGGPDQTYDARCEITAAERPSTVAWMQRGKDDGFTEWRYAFAPADGGTEVTESWTLIREFPAGLVDEERTTMMLEAFGKGIDDTLANLKSVAEG
jgi:hypothetical protein